MQKGQDHQSIGDATHTPLSSELNLNLLTAADQAMAAHDWEQAVDILSQLLAGTQNENDSDIKNKYDLLVKRATCYLKLGNVDAELTDREAIYALTQQINDVPMQVKSLIDLEYAYTKKGDNDKALSV